MRLACVGIVAFAALLSGCATVVKGSSQTLTIITDPEGASCELKREGESIGVVDPTPGSVEVAKDKDEIDVTCKKKGFKESNTYLSSTFQTWTVGNLLIGGLIGLAIDASSGAITQYPSEISLKLTPEQFASETDRQNFYEDWQQQVLQNSAKAKIAAAKTCSGEQCEVLLARIDRETQQALAGIQANRGLHVNGEQAAAPQASTQTASLAAPAGSGAVATTGGGYLRKGARWTYRIQNQQRTVGTVRIEILDAAEGRVRERITKEGSSAYASEREVNAAFDPKSFQPLVQLPGGYLLAEVSPYFAPGTALRIGDTWNDVPATFSLPHAGTHTYVMSVRVTGQETVKVMAGEYQTWRIEASSAALPGQPNRIKCTFWYSPEQARTVKMNLKVESPYLAAQSDDTYDLVSYEAAQPR
jgi:hypothetical protein